MPSADFSHGIGVGYPTLSYNFSRTRLPEAHESSPGVNTRLSVRGRRVYATDPYTMDRGLNLVLQAGPDQFRLTRFLYVIPHIRATLPWQSCLLQGSVAEYPLQ
jgi:hypothetical protein